MKTTLSEKSGNKFSRKFKDSIVLDYNNGLRVSEICKKYETNKYSVRHVLLYAGVPLGRDVKRKPITQSETMRIIKEFNGGARVKYLCSKYNLSVAGVGKILHRNGVILRYDAKPVSQSVLKSIELCKSGKSTKEICEEIGKNRATVNVMLRYHGLKPNKPGFNRKKHTLNDNYFSCINSGEKAYFLGLLFADGNVSSSSFKINIYLQEVDGYLIQKFKKALGYTGPIGKRLAKSTNHSDQIYIQINSKKIKEDLGKLGCVPRKATILRFPKLPKKYFWDFFRGYFDGDGCVMSKKLMGGTFSRIIVIASCIYFNQQLSKILLDRVGIKSSVRRTVNMCSHLGVYNRRGVELIRDNIYKDASVFMKRKKNKFYA